VYERRDTSRQNLITPQDSGAVTEVRPRHHRLWTALCGTSHHARDQAQPSVGRHCNDENVPHLTYNVRC
jgi:hypothetical protein